MPTTAEIALHQSNLARVPLRVFASEAALPADLPPVGYGQLVMVTTADGVRGKIRLSDGSFVNLYTINTTIDNTITNVTNNTIYQIQDLPDPDTLNVEAIPTVLSNNGVKYWGWGFIPTLLFRKAVEAHRGGGAASLSIPYTLQLSDADRYFSFINAGAGAVTLPDLAWNELTELELARNGAGAVTITPASGVTINGSSKAISISKQYGIVVLKLFDAALKKWVAYGDIA